MLNFKQKDENKYHKSFHRSNVDSFRLKNQEEARNSLLSVVLRLTQHGIESWRNRRILSVGPMWGWAREPLQQSSWMPVSVIGTEHFMKV
jgi:hypothetical protein